MNIYIFIYVIRIFNIIFEFLTIQGMRGIKCIIGFSKILYLNGMSKMGVDENRTLAIR